MERLRIIRWFAYRFQTLAIILSVVIIIVAGKFLIVPMLRKVANTGVRELLIASALLIVFSISF
ncbi:hypothetical protein [Dokdonia sp. Dokd-P16]|uniref:hypothetical protein n=1 Tax=Dokdonia sp. Dokd-P16 TaxID=2173169 RepID=UPI001EF28B7B|nr:hypothetical protein [Dokdonia sp. Dokd-P16]